ncbi:MAG: hypothetical protein P8Y47_02345 [Alphaproteobacteria bacterium]
MVKTKKRILHDFEIVELSAVNKPAQEGALAHIAKAVGLRASKSLQDSRERDSATIPPGKPVSAVLSEPGKPSALAKALSDVQSALSASDTLLQKVDALEEELAGLQ